MSMVVRDLQFNVFQHRWITYRDYFEKMFFNYSINLKIAFGEVLRCKNQEFLLRTRMGKGMHNIYIHVKVTHKPLSDSFYFEEMDKYFFSLPLT